jgi:hypothetical protein
MWFGRAQAGELAGGGGDGRGGPGEQVTAVTGVPVTAAQMAETNNESETFAYCATKYYRFK